MVALSGWDGALWAGAVRGVGAGTEPTSFSRFSEISDAISEVEGVGAAQASARTRDDGDLAG